MWKLKIIVLSLAVLLFCVQAYAHPNHSTVVLAGGLTAGLAVRRFSGTNCFAAFRSDNFAGGTVALDGAAARRRHFSR